MIMKFDEKSGIRRNSFYDTNEDLGKKDMTTEELYNYCRLVGMPFTDDYDELIASLKGPSDKTQELKYTPEKNAIKAARN